MAALSLKLLASMACALEARVMAAASAPPSTSVPASAMEPSVVAPVSVAEPPTTSDPVPVSELASTNPAPLAIVISPLSVTPLEETEAVPAFDRHGHVAGQRIAGAVPPV